MIELDKRIIEGKKPLTCFDAEQAKEFLGKECYFSNCKVHYKNLSAFEKFVSLTDYCIGTLTAIMDLGDRVFDVDQQCKEFRYCLPCEWVKEEKKEPRYRPYTMREFNHEYAIGEIIFRIRDKRDPEHVYQFLYIGHSNSLVYLGGWTLSLEDLFAYFETAEGVGDEETWHPFGILEE